ncbi:MAG: SOS response-associated peptidase [Alphaproteobacteria bacterium]
MCGRFLLYSSVDTLARTFGLAPTDQRVNLGPRYNIAPTQEVATVGRNKAGGRGLAMMHWGLIPSWAKDRSLAAKMINARGESVHEKPAFRAAFKSRRCLIPADGFYEWHSENGRKRPYVLEPAAGGPMALGGLFERWRDPENGDLWSCTIVTTDASADIAHLHHRMPLVLTAAHWDAWLDAAPDEARSLVGPAPEGTLRFRPVDQRVNNVKNDDPELIAPPPELGP